MVIIFTNRIGKGITSGLQEHCYFTCQLRLLLQAVTVEENLFSSNNNLNWD